MSKPVSGEPSTTSTSENSPNDSHVAPTSPTFGMKKATLHHQLMIDQGGVCRRCTKVKECAYRIVYVESDNIQAWCERCV
jgi:hypothetical protein